MGGRGADRAAFDQALHYQRRNFRSGCDRASHQFLVGFAERGRAGLAACALKCGAYRAPKAFAGLVLASRILGSLMLTIAEI